MIAGIWRARTALAFADALEAGVTEHELRDGFEQVLADAWIMVSADAVHRLLERHQAEGKWSHGLSLALDRLTVLSDAADE